MNERDALAPSAEAEQPGAAGDGEARVRGLLELASDFYWETDAEHRFTVLDVSARADPGFVPSTRIGRTRWETPSELPDAEGWREHRALLDAHLPFRDFATARPTSSGELRYYVVSGEPMFDPQGRFRGYRGVGREISAQKRAERALRDSEERHRNLVEMSEDAIVVRQDGLIRFVNPAAVRLLRAASGAELVGRPMHELAHPDDAALVQERERRMDAERKPLPPAELRLRRADGSYAEVEAMAAPIMYGAREAVLTMWRDLGPRRQAERALRDSEQRFQAFMRNSPAIAWIKDAQLRYTYISPSYEAQLERRSAEFVGRSDSELWPPAMARELRANDEAVLRSRAAMQTIEAGAYADGREFRWLVVKFPLPDASGADGVAGMGIDVTQRLQSEYKLKEYSERNRQLLRRLAELQEVERGRLAEALHDMIGQNLTALGIGLDIVRAELPPGSAALARRLADMSRLLEQTISATRDVMADLRPTALDEHGLLPALHAYAQQFQERTGLRASVSGTLVRDLLPRDHKLAVLRVVQEALANAARHSGASAIVIAVTQAPHWLRVTVEDNGRGLSEPLGARSLMRGGWGLPLMRERAQAIGGELRLESPAAGTRVVLDIPLPDADRRHPG